MHCKGVLEYIACKILDRAYLGNLVSAYPRSQHCKLRLAKLEIEKVAVVPGCQ